MDAGVRATVGTTRRRLPLRVVTALLVACVAAVAATSLALLRTLNERATRRLAATSFLENGRALTAALAESCVPSAAEQDADLWRRLDWFFETLSGAEPTLESLSVEREGLTVFERQASLRGVPQARAAVPAAATDEVMAEHVVQDVGGRSVPVVMFTRRAVGTDGKELTLQLGLRRESLAQDERLAADAVRTMYRVALATHAVTFGVVLGIVFWLMGRERDREERRREEEHLAFAGMMANGVVHDFRNPMSSIRLDAQMLEREARKPDARTERLAELAGRMRVTLDRIEAVFQEFFFVSQPKSAAPETLNLGACVRECVAILQARFEAAGVSASFLFQEESLAVRAVAAPLRRALLNVLGNAVAFSPRGGEVDLVVARHKNEVVLDVLDRGPGIPPADRERVFEMFVTSRPGGTGLGLFLARTGLATSGGRIEARDRPGGGTCIRIRLPQAEPKETAQA